jgi:hypothetical protein
MKHRKGWSFRDLERELGNNLVYRRFTHFDAEITPDFSLASPVLDSALTASNPSRAGQENHGPPESMGHWRVADQAGNSNQRHRAPLLREITGSTDRIWKTLGFCNRL